MFKCDKCKSIFTSKHRLKYHIDNNVCNDNSKPFKCLFCSKKYKTKFTLLQHLRIKHYIIKKNKNYKKQNNKNVKEQNKNLICQYCDKIFTRKDNLKRHIKKYCKKKKLIIM